MIVRILAEGQYAVSDRHLDELNELDTAVQEAIDHDDRRAFATRLAALLATVRRLGSPVPDSALVASALVLPAPDAELSEVAAMLSDDGLIPG